MTPAKKATGRPAPAAAKKRTRLAPDVRREQILKAALAEFTAHGYAATSIAKIAERAGISKGNVYVHFASKDEIFETLLSAVNGRPESGWAALRNGRDFTAFVDFFIDSAYAALTPDHVAVIRLLIADGHRVPGVLERLQKAITGVHAERQKQIDQLVREGQLEASPLTDNFNLALSPLVYVAVAQMVFSPDAAQAEVVKMKAAHKKLLQALLRKPQD